MVAFLGKTEETIFLLGKYATLITSAVESKSHQLFKNRVTVRPKSNGMTYQTPLHLFKNNRLLKVLAHQVFSHCCGDQKYACKKKRLLTSYLNPPATGLNFNTNSPLEFEKTGPKGLFDPICDRLLAIPTW